MIEKSYCDKKISVRAYTISRLKCLAEKREIPDDVINRLIDFYAKVNHKYYLLGENKDD